MSLVDRYRVALAQRVPVMSWNPSECVRVCWEQGQEGRGLVTVHSCPLL